LGARLWTKINFVIIGKSMDKKDIVKALLRDEPVFCLSGFITGVHIERTEAPNLPEVYWEEYSKDPKPMSLKSDRVRVKLEFMFDTNNLDALQIREAVQEVNLMEHDSCPFVIAKIKR
jgi:hypothetical protein